MSKDIADQMIDSPKKLFPKTKTTNTTKGKKMATPKRKNTPKTDLKRTLQTHKAEIKKLKHQIKKHKLLMKQAKLVYKLSK